MVRDRIEFAATDSMQSLMLEAAGHALFDMYPERRGNIYNDEVYRLSKSLDATSTYSLDEETEDGMRKALPPNHKFSQNDVIMLTLQPAGAGDFFSSASTPTNNNAVSLEARVLSTGPTYVDVAILGGKFEATFGPAPNNFGPSGKGDKKMRLRVDRYFSNVPYQRMVDAIGQVTNVPEKEIIEQESNQSDEPRTVDNFIRQAILSSFACTNKESPSFGDVGQLRNLVSFYHQNAIYCYKKLCMSSLFPFIFHFCQGKKLASPPLRDSTELTNQVLAHFQSNPTQIFSQFNGPQLAAIGAALTRRLTMIQGPPGKIVS